MKVVWDSLSPLHRNVGGQEGVGTPDPGRRGPVQRGVKVHHLHQAVHTRIGTACAKGADRMRSKAAQGRFEFVLHGVARKLALPATVGLAVVADTQRHPGHGAAWGRAGG